MTQTTNKPPTHIIAEHIKNELSKELSKFGIIITIIEMVSDTTFEREACINIGKQNRPYAEHIDSIDDLLSTTTYVFVLATGKLRIAFISCVAYTSHEYNLEQENSIEEAIEEVLKFYKPITNRIAKQ
jgi:hypothetical protein